jgi:hypothetical protein
MQRNPWCQRHAYFAGGVVGPWPGGVGWVVGRLLVVGRVSGGRCTGSQIIGPAPADPMKRHTTELTTAAAAEAINNHILVMTRHMVRPFDSRPRRRLVL